MKSAEPSLLHDSEYHVHVAIAKLCGHKRIGYSLGGVVLTRDYAAHLQPHSHVLYGSLCKWNIIAMVRLTHIRHLGRMTYSS